MRGNIFTCLVCLMLFATICSAQLGQETYGQSSSGYWRGCRSGYRYYQEGDYIWARCFLGGYYWLRCEEGRWRQVTSCRGAYPQYGGGNGRGLGLFAYW